jgi:lysozyme
MRTYNLTSAANEIGKSKQIIRDAIETGRLNAKKKGRGFEIDAADLFEAFPSTQTDRSQEQKKTPSVVDLLESQARLLQDQLASERDTIDDLRQRLNRAERILDDEGPRPRSGIQQGDGLFHPRFFNLFLLAALPAIATYFIAKEQFQTVKHDPELVVAKVVPEAAPSVEVTPKTSQVIATDRTKPFGVYDLPPKFEFPTSVPRGTFGISVSENQGTIDWAQVLKSGVSFVFIKAQNGGTGLDKNFHANWEGAKEHNIPAGVYHTLSPLSDVEEQVSNFLEVINLKEKMPIFIDIGEFKGIDSNGAEIDQWHRMSATQIAEKIEYFKEVVEKANGGTVMLRTTKSWWDRKVGGDADFVLRDSDLWIADTNALSLKEGRPRSPGNREPRYWQFTSTGRVPGISGAVNILAERR